MTSTAEQVESEQEDYERERADEAADEAAEQDEGEQAADDTDDEPVEPVEPVAVAIGPDELRKAERANDAHRKKLAGILGDDYVAQECPLCSTVGYVPELPPPGSTFTFMQDEHGVSLDFRPPVAGPDFKPASDKKTCPECDGYGATLTGAKEPAQTVWQCGACGGAGWIGQGALVIAPGATPVAAAPSYLSPLPAVPEGPVDQWGRPTGHQHWGVPPAMIPG